MTSTSRQLLAVPLVLATAAIVGLFEPLAIAFATPWIAATIWVAWRVGWRILWSSDTGAFPTQSSQLPGFGGPRS